MNTRKKTKFAAAAAAAVMLCGFSWDWTVSFATSVLFPVKEAVDTQMVTDFPGIVDPDDLTFYLCDPTMAQQLAEGIRGNLSTDIYSGIELPDMTQEPLGKKVIRTILDRLFH